MEIQMGSNNSIVLICDDKEIIASLTSKFVLLRDIDRVLESAKHDAVNFLKTAVPNISFLYCKNNDAECLELVKAIRATKLLKNAPVILIIDNCNQDFVVSAFDEGITDFIPMPINDAELLMRTIWAIQKNEALTNNEVQRKFLAKIGVVEQDTGFYTSRYGSELLQNEIELAVKYKNNSALILVETDFNSKSVLSKSIISQIIKNSTRSSDIICSSRADRFFILLKKTKLNGAFTVFERIKQSLPEQTSVSAAIIEVTNDNFTTLENLLTATLKKALIQGNSVLIADNAESKNKNILGKIKKDKKEELHFKLFKNSYKRKVEQIILPAFKKTEEEARARFDDIEIKLDNEENEIFFSLKKNEIESSFKIVYPGFSKINIDILNVDGKKRDFERLTFDLKEITEESFERLCKTILSEFEKLIIK